jgi:hypothetical protein
MMLQDCLVLMVRCMGWRMCCLVLWVRRATLAYLGWLVGKASRVNPVRLGQMASRAAKALSGQPDHMEFQVKKTFF